MEPDYLITENSNNEAQEQTEVKKPKDPNIKILVLQCAICILIIVFCFVSKTFFSDLFTEIKGWYTENVAVDTDISQVLNTESAIGGPLETSLENFKVQGGEFSLPVLGTVSSPYGYRTDPFTNEPSAHNGIDIAANTGSAIFAVSGGKIETAIYSSGDYGNYIIIDHNGFKTLYAHLSKISVKKGQTVSGGEKIGECGSSGRSTGPHLHFELRIGTKRIDPTPFLNLNNK